MSNRLLALKPIPGTIQIAPGQEFIETDPEQVRYWIDAGFARALFVDIPIKATIPHSAPAPKLAAIFNSRNWDGLFWDGATVAILASGESFTQEQSDAVRAWRSEGANRRAIAVNTTYQRACWADILYACDGRWWEAEVPNRGCTYFEDAKDTFQGELWSQDKPVAEKLGLHYIRSEKQRGLSRRAGIIHQMTNGGFQAINLAFLAGAAKILLLGFDCKGGHWHGDHPAGINNRSPFAIWIKEAQYLARDLVAEKVEVFNCSPDSAIPWFTKTTLAEALQ